MHDSGDGLAGTHWWRGGRLNRCANPVTRHAARTPQGEALEYEGDEGDEGEVRSLT